MTTKKILLGLVILLILSVPTCFAEEHPVYIINHVLTDNIFNVNGSPVLNGSPALGFKLAADANAATVTYSTLDQLLLNQGRHIIYAKIVDLANDKVIKQTKASLVDADKTNYKYSYLAKWNYTTERGLFGYQLVVDDKIIGTFAITIN